ncbi:MAG: DUF1028 domain-containing protein [Sneathiella sp.]
MKRQFPGILALFSVLLVMSFPAAATWSIVAVDPQTREVGGASATCTPYAWAIFAPVPDKGIIVTQAASNGAARRKGAALISQNVAPDEIIATITAPEFDPRHMDQQHGIATLRNEAATAGYTGDNNGRVAADLQGELVSVQGNILTSTKVVSSALAAFRNASKNPANNLADRLLAALEAGSAEGGDRRCGDQTAVSAYLIVVKPMEDPETPRLKISVPLQYRYSVNAVKKLREEYDALYGR